jgi:hypothetical protein
MVTALVALGAAIVGGVATYMTNEATREEMNALADQAAAELGATRDQVYSMLGFNPTTGQIEDMNKLEAVMVEAPEFNIDQYQTDQFEGITEQDLYEDPSFQYRQDMANEALMAELGGLGLIDSGAAAYELANLNQNMASQEYSNVYDRALSKYNANMNANNQNFMQDFNIWNANLNNQIQNANRQLQADSANMSAEEARRLAAANATMGIGQSQVGINGQVASTNATLPNPITQGINTGINAGLMAQSFQNGAGNAVSNGAQKQQTMLNYYNTNKLPGQI